MTFLLWTHLFSQLGSTMLCSMMMRHFLLPAERAICNESSFETLFSSQEATKLLFVLVEIIFTPVCQSVLLTFKLPIAKRWYALIDLQPPASTLNVFVWTPHEIKTKISIRHDACRSPQAQPAFYSSSSLVFVNMTRASCHVIELVFYFMIKISM